MRNVVAASGGTPGARFVDPVVLARVRNLELVARSVVDGFINGLHRSPYFGASVDFAEHRGYVPGDDIRRVDWRLFARTDRFYVKEYEADSNSNFAVRLDAFDDDVVEHVPPSAKHMDVVLHVLDRLAPRRPGRLGPPLRKLAEHFG